MSKQIFIVEIEDGQSTRWSGDAKRLEEGIEFHVGHFCRRFSSGAIPRVTVTELPEGTLIMRPDTNHCGAQKISE